MTEEPPANAWTLARLKLTFDALLAAGETGAPLSPEALAGLWDLGDLPADLAPRAANDAGRVATHLMRPVIRRSKPHETRLERLLAVSSAHIGDQGLGRELFSHLTIVLALHRTLVRHGALTATRAEVGALQGELLQAVEQLEPRVREAGCADLHRGNIASLTDRAAAARLYRQALDRPGALTTSTIDVGAHSFLLADEAARSGSDPEAPRLRNETAQAFAAAAGRHGEVRANLLWSVDLGFFQIYGPYWFNLAPYLLREGLGLVMAVIGPADAVERAIAEARDLITRLATFHGLPDPASYAAAFTFIPVAEPASGGERKTFYAVARYLLAPAVLTFTGRPVMVLDADFTLRDDIGAFVDRLASVEVGLTFSRGLSTLWPWRRTMAGCGWFAPSPASLAVLERISAYVAAGLPLSPSWTLDQNALTYALEDPGDAVVADLGRLARPFAQDGVRSKFEQTWRETAGAAPA